MINDTDLPADFDAQAYLRLNPDVAVAGVDPAAHYLANGRRERRLYRDDAPLEEPLPPDFDAETYLRLNPDVAAAGVDPAAHYLADGRREQRSYHRVPLLSISTKSSEPNDQARYKFAGDVIINPKLIAFYFPWQWNVSEVGEAQRCKDEACGKIEAPFTNPGRDHQSHAPLDGYRDSAALNIQIKQTTLAEKFGIYAFCYWVFQLDELQFSEELLDIRRNDDTITMPFCICWANKSSQKLQQKPSRSNSEEVSCSSMHAENFFARLMKYLHDSRYLRVDGKLLVLVESALLIENCKDVVIVWRDLLRGAGLGEMQLCVIKSYEDDDPALYGFDAAVEFPIKTRSILESQIANPPTDDDLSSKRHALNYSPIVDSARRSPIVNYTLYRGVSRGWRSTVNYRSELSVVYEETLTDFQCRLAEALRQQVVTSGGGHQLVFIESWNDWRQGAHLEPDEKAGFDNLLAVEGALRMIQRRQSSS